MQLITINHKNFNLEDDIIAVSSVTENLEKFLTVITTKFVYMYKPFENKLELLFEKKQIKQEKYNFIFIEVIDGKTLVVPNSHLYLTLNSRGLNVFYKENLTASFIYNNYFIENDLGSHLISIEENTDLMYHNKISKIYFNDENELQKYFYKQMNFE